MIQKIVKNSDIKFCVDDDSKIQDKFIIKFYTINKSKGVTRTADDVITENEKRYIKLNWSTIKLLDNGMLNYEVNNLDSDADYDDGVYNSTFTRTTYYYLCTDGDGLADAIEEIELRVDQITTDITGLKSNNATLDTQMGDLQNRMSSVETKSTSNENNITGLQNRMSSVETKSTNNENSINTMSTDYAALVSRLEKLEANGSNKPDSLDDRVTALEKSKNSLDKRIEDATRITNCLMLNWGAKSTYYLLYDDIYGLENRVGALERGTQGSNESTSSLATNNDNIVNRASALATNNDNIANRASALEDRASTLATNNDNIVNRASALETNNDNIANRVLALENIFQDFDKRMLNVDKYSKDFIFRFPGWSSYEQITYILETLGIRVEALERGTQGSNENTSSLATNNDNIVNRASALATNNDNIANRASALEDRASTLATNNDNIVNRASALETNNNSLDDRITALENSTNDLDNTISNLWTELTSFYANWASDESNSLNDIIYRLIWLNKDITALETR